MADLNDLLQHLIEQRGSDLHVKAGSVPHLRVHGMLRRTPFKSSTAAELEGMVAELVPVARTRILAERGEVSIAYGVAGLGRFRLNVYRQRGSYGLSVRLVSPGVPSIDTLELPDIVEALTEHESGLILVTGPASSGKTTTVAAMLDRINSTRAVHIVTLEDPIEVLLADKSSMVSQREVGVDARSTSDAMRRMSHLDPDVIFVSELSDLETIEQVVAVAGSGRLVIGIAPTASAAETIGYLLSYFELPRQTRIRHAIASTLRGIVSQQLLHGTGSRGLVPAVEVLTGTPAVVDAIVAGAQSADLEALMARGDEQGMVTMDQALLELVRAGSVTESAAIAASHDPTRLQTALR